MVETEGQVARNPRMTGVGEGSKGETGSGQERQLGPPESCSPPNHTFLCSTPPSKSRGVQYVLTCFLLLPLPVVSPWLQLWSLVGPGRRKHWVAGPPLFTLCLLPHPSPGAPLLPLASLLKWQGSVGLASALLFLLQYSRAPDFSNLTLWEI